MKSKIDSEIIDLIMDHFNILEIGGIAKDKQILTTEDFDDIVKLAEKLYYEKMMEHSTIEGKA
jgi:hypothetical protein|tara:strand:+ start:1506 stop:1694 length:189 start_codon:yes stop_codon:yes gene_type:complete